MSEGAAQGQVDPRPPGRRVLAVPQRQHAVVVQPRRAAPHHRVAVPEGEDFVASEGWDPDDLLEPIAEKWQLFLKF